MQKQTHTFKFEILSSFSGLNSEIWLPLSSLTCRAIILDVITIAKVLMQPMHADDITCGESALATEKRKKYMRWVDLLLHEQEAQSPLEQFFRPPARGNRENKPRSSVLSSAPQRVSG